MKNADSDGFPGDSIVEVRVGPDATTLSVHQQEGSESVLDVERASGMPGDSGDSASCHSDQTMIQSSAKSSPTLPREGRESIGVGGTVYSIVYGIIRQCAGMLDDAERVDLAARISREYLKDHPEEVRSRSLNASQIARQTNDKLEQILRERRSPSTDVPTLTDASPSAAVTPQSLQTRRWNGRKHR